MTYEISSVKNFNSNENVEPHPSLIIEEHQEDFGYLMHRTAQFKKIKTKKRGGNQLSLADLKTLFGVQ